MRRRDFIPLVGVVIAARPFAACPQQLTIPLIGYIGSSTAAAAGVELAALQEGLNQAGFIEGRSVAIEYRWAEGEYNRLPSLAAELADRQVSVIIASGLPAALAAKAATSVIPIVFAIGVDPVGFGLVESLSRPGGNLTGGTVMFDLLHEKRLQLLHELAPDSASLGFMVNPKNPNAASHSEHVEAAAQTLGLKLTVLTAGGADEIESAFATGRGNAIGALLIGDDPFFDIRQIQLVALAAQYMVPTMYFRRDFVVAGGLISYNPRAGDISRQVGNYAGRILKGAKPTELPVVQPTRFELVINLKTAKALGLSVPPSILGRADELIE
jgi:putative ABC transport system substrate-binding protein